LTREGTCNFAVIGGSEAYTLLKGRKIVGERLGPVETPYGPSEALYLVEHKGAAFLFLSRHGEERYSVTAPFINYRANVYALKDRGVEWIVSWSGPGIINRLYQVGDLVIASDLMDETSGRHSTFFEGKGWGFIRQNPVFCPQLSRILHEALIALNIRHIIGGTYVCTRGPRLETPAEIHKYGILDADFVGMTVAPECFLARELEMSYVPLCYLTNLAEGIREREYRAGVLFEGLLTPDEKERVDATVAQLPTIVTEVARRVQGVERDSPCACSMERYRRAGILPEDWHEWVSVPARSG
jgi:5'-methylthioadenosine phosphorylase